MSALDTATSPAGVVHYVTGPPWQTLCGEDATGWSRAVTIAQNLGMVLWCPACVPPEPEYDAADVFDQAATDYARIETGEL